MSEKGDEDPAQVKTIENPAVAAPSLGENESMAELQRELAVTQGDLENLRVQSLKEREELNKKLSDLEVEKQKLIDDNNRLRGLGVAAAESTEVLKKSPQATWELVRKELREGRVREAIPVLNGFLKDFPKDKNVYVGLILLGMSHYRNGEYQEAVLSFNQALDKFSKKKDISLVWFCQGASFHQMKQYEDAKLFLAETIKRNPKGIEAREAKKLTKKKAKAPVDLFALFPNFTSSALKPSS